ncbi:hypothetical protein BJ684DRAFT_17366 [Piptocephalis cylindrospora]|uniref:Uncharacterized protein n=1 Tax=Piptocephalis cylindrospora TaxID=1907219 RepID=A0A4P9Y232_9FUNG|nr:hypothetical protein BJ684DRAFT_17366 [Piptocephalis cylindrospora]|eukprot:RKP12111.1 hypothetical protein BJ684DRAFT_17366 [Piptocephalis cylindrospora]
MPPGAPQLRPLPTDNFDTPISGAASIRSKWDDWYSRGWVEGKVSNNPFLLTLATVAGPNATPLRPLAPLQTPKSDPRHVMEPLPTPVGPKSRRLAYIPPALRTRSLGQEAEKAPLSPSIPPPSPALIPTRAKTPARAPSPPAVRSVSPTSPANFRPGTTLTSVREVVACLRRYEHLSGLFESQVLPVTPIEPKIHRLGEERVRDGVATLGSPARILLDSGKVLLLHPVSE